VIAPDAEAAADAAPEVPVRGLAAAGIHALRTRIDLAAVELEIQVLLLLRMLAWIVAAVACLLMALAFGATALIVALWNTHRMFGLLGGSAAFILLGTLLIWLGLRSVRNRPGLLSGSLEQLGADERRVRSRS
jgi:uncharacterized membrane protein YqjE